MNKILKKENREELEAFVLENFPEVKPIIDTVVGILTKSYRQLFFKKGDEDILGVRLDGSTIVFLPLEVIRRYEKDFYVDDVFVKVGDRKVFVGNSIKIVPNLELRNQISAAMIFESLYPKGYVFYEEIQNADDLGVVVKEFEDAKIYESEDGEDYLQIVFEINQKMYTAPVQKDENVFRVILASGSDKLLKKEFTETDKFVVESLAESIDIIENMKPAKQPKSSFLDQIELDTQPKDDSANVPDGLVDEEIKTDAVSTSLFTKL